MMQRPRSSAAGSRLGRRLSRERPARPIVALLSDFGLSDGYVAAMKGVILTRCPQALLVDITHLIPVFDVRSASYVLKTVFEEFPPDAIFLAVVDPGVGTERFPLAIRTNCRRYLIGPDNGIFSWVLASRPAVEARILDLPKVLRRTVSATFHGRDVFAPAAAYLACGGLFERLGNPCQPMIGPWVSAKRSGDQILGEVVHIDRFGNLITNITQQDLGRTPDLTAWGVALPGVLTLPALSRTYGDLPVGGIGAVVGSSGHLEIVVNQGNASHVLCRAAGASVTAFPRS